MLTIMRNSSAELPVTQQLSDCLNTLSMVANSDEMTNEAYLDYRNESQYLIGKACLKVNYCCEFRRNVSKNRYNEVQFRKNRHCM